MTETGNAPEIDAALERSRFRDWVNRVIATMKAAEGWTVADTAKHAKISVDTLYSWKKQGDTWPDGKPKPKTVAKFCTNLGLHPAEPYRILGWISEAVGEPQPIMPHLARKLARFLQDPNVDEEEKRFIILSIERLLAPYRYDV